MPPRVMQKVNTRPRVFAKVADSVKDPQLPDKFWLIRDVRVGFDDGTPVTEPVELGPYSADLATAEGDESFDGKHYVQETTHRAVVNMDEEPTVGDRARVKRRGRQTEYFRIVGRTKERAPAWGGEIFLWHIQLAKTEEH